MRCRLNTQTSAGSSVSGSTAVFQSSAGQQGTLFDEEMPLEVAQMYVRHGFSACPRAQGRISPAKARLGA